VASPFLDELILLMTLTTQILWLFILAIPVACISWTITREEVFRELRDICSARSKKAKALVVKKFFYLLTCEYCFSHYVAFLFLLMTQYTLLIADWRGYIIAGFSLVWIANLYMSLYSFLRADIKKENVETAIAEKEKSKEKSSS
jgi:hypothetical protein